MSYFHGVGNPQTKQQKRAWTSELFRFPYYILPIVVFSFLLHLIEKWSSCGRALGHMESSDTKLKMSGPRLCKQQQKKKQRFLMINFKGFFHTFKGGGGEVGGSGAGLLP